MHALGTHLLVELRDCDHGVIGDVAKVRDALVEAARRARATVVEVAFHEFSPFGVSGMVIIAESHLSIHTWPEYGYAAVDIFTCGELIKPEEAANYLIKRFKCQAPSMMEMKRGILTHDNTKLPHKVSEEEAERYARPKELQVVP